MTACCCAFLDRSSIAGRSTIAASSISAPIEGPVDADDGDVLTQWALDGLGIVLKPVFEVADYLAEGRLVEVLPAAKPQPVTLGIIYPSRRLLPPRTKSFIDLAVDELRRHVAHELRKLPERRLAEPETGREGPKGSVQL